MKGFYVDPKKNKSINKYKGYHTWTHYDTILKMKCKEKLFVAFSRLLFTLAFAE